MKTAVIFYHKNIDKLYEKAWIDICVRSIYNQTFKGFDVYELNYGGGEERYTNGTFLNNKFENHIGAMNFLYDMLFEKYDIVFNTNMDDYYHPQRLELQMNAFRQGYDLVSSNFVYIENGRQTKRFVFSGVNIGEHLLRKHNVIAHPVVGLSKNFWTLKYQDLLGYEDLDLWQRAFKAGKKFVILKDFLLFYRIHKNQVTKQ